MRVIPAIDLLDGQAVRLKQGLYDQVTTYDQRPGEIAKEWRQVVDRLHVVDLEGARGGKPAQVDLVREVVEGFGDGVQVGGGVRNLEAVEAYFSLGVSRVVLGTAAIKNPEFVREAAKLYPDRVIVAVDAKDGMVATEGWLDVSEMTAVDLARQMADVPLAGVLYTDIARDGMEVGPNIEETARLAREGGVPVIASGGVGTLAHLSALAATDADIQSVIVGRALHERRFTLTEAIAAAGPV
ncbi:MAG: 1-(5-phosphoribosyl)-5-[(5-phosphoribosylamino)methylideneamino]imidazole-4-carboxamide isomerase [Polyangiaceae bacterium]|nr:1-(5-phosphoribosyl)-5-[(5-phosphoribosylamino)methylideneamino]imidazole-4-carboxamide isomerase [Polyangiaceae bacterium]